MRLKHIISTTILSCALTFGIGLGLANNQEMVQEAKADSYTFYLIDDQKLLGDNVYAYTYGGTSGEELGAWPGTKMTTVTYGVYCVTMSEQWHSHSAIIFNNNSGNQTWNIEKTWDEQYLTRNGFVINDFDTGDYSSKVVGSLLTYDESYDVGYYLKGTFDSWGSALKMNVVDSTASISNIELANNGEVQALFKYSATGEVWHKAAASGVAGKPSYPVSTNNGNAIVTYANTYDVSLNLSTKAYTLTPTEFYKVVVNNDNNKKYELSPATGGFEATIPSLSAGDVLSLEYADSASSFTANTWPANNLKENKTVKVSATSVHVWLDTPDSILWVDGYGLTSENLQNFCGSLLKNTISAGSCVNPTTTQVEETQTWTYFTNWYNTLGDDKAAFITAVANARFGDDLTYANVLDEAACRYAWLMTKYPTLTPFSGVELPSSRYIVPTAYNISNTVIIIVVFSSISLISLGGFFFLRKRKEDR